MDENADLREGRLSREPQSNIRPRRMLWLIAAAVLLVGAGTAFLALRGDDVAAVRPWVPPEVESPFSSDTDDYGEAEIQEHCLDPGGRQTVIAFFDGADPDPVMRQAAQALDGDDRIASVQMETRQEAYERFRELFADQPELVTLVRPESLPASVTLLPADGVYPGDLADAITDELSEIESVSAGCELPE